MRVSLQEQLLLNGLRKDLKYLHGFRAQSFADKCIFFIPASQLIELSCLASRKHLIDLSDQRRELRDKFDNTLGNDHNAEVHSE